MSSILGTTLLNREAKGNSNTRPLSVKAFRGGDHNDKFVRRLIEKKIGGATGIDDLVIPIGIPTRNESKLVGSSIRNFDRVSTGIPEDDPTSFTAKAQAVQTFYPKGNKIGNFKFRGEVMIDDSVEDQNVDGEEEDSDVIRTLASFDTQEGIDALYFMDYIQEGLPEDPTFTVTRSTDNKYRGDSSVSIAYDLVGGNGSVVIVKDGFGSEWDGLEFNISDTLQREASKFHAITMRVKNIALLPNLISESIGKEEWTRNQDKVKARILFVDSAGKYLVFSGVIMQDGSEWVQIIFDLQDPWTADEDDFAAFQDGAEISRMIVELKGIWPTEEIPLYVDDIRYFGFKDDVVGTAFCGLYSYDGEDFPAYGESLPVGPLSFDPSNPWSEIKPNDFIEGSSPWQKIEFITAVFGRIDLQFDTCFGGYPSAFGIDPTNAIDKTKLHAVSAALWIPNGSHFIVRLYGFDDDAGTGSSDSRLLLSADGGLTISEHTEGDGSAALAMSYDVFDAPCIIDDLDIESTVAPSGQPPKETTASIGYDEAAILYSLTGILGTYAKGMGISEKDVPLDVSIIDGEGNVVYSEQVPTSFSTAYSFGSDQRRVSGIGVMDRKGLTPLISSGDWFVLIQPQRLHSIDRFDMRRIKVSLSLRHDGTFGAGE